VPKRPSSRYVASVQTANSPFAAATACVLVMACHTSLVVLTAQAAPPSTRRGQQHRVRQ
jgi:hypothetical protein